MDNVARIKKIFDTELKSDKLGENFEEINESAVKLFQKLFVENLHFDLVRGQFGEVGEQISTDDWNKAAEAKSAYLIAESDEFRIIYIVINKLTRYRERFAISSIKKQKWARKGEYICIFFANYSSVWDMVCPHYTKGRTILRRFILGEGENHRTVSQNLILMDVSLTEPLFERVQEAFKVQVVTKEFYEKYKDNFNRIKTNLLHQGIEIKNAKKFAHLLLNRLMFIYFIQKKGWINNDKQFIYNFIKMYQNLGENDLLYEKWLSTLFFAAMSKPRYEKNISNFNSEINNILNNIPFLNGGLFEKYDVDKLNIEVSDNLLLEIIENFLEEYNFTITEESAYDLDIAIDPAMLGKIYESLIAEEERGKSGIFYTPRIEVDLMCRMGLYEYFLKDKFNSLPKNNKNVEKDLLDFIFTPIETWKQEKSSSYEYLRKPILSINIVDPACGSGAFLVGILQVIIELLIKLGLTIDYSLKESIIYNSIYGVDIKDWAVRMAEFRLWLALIENEESTPNRTPILPNFSFKLKCGDSIVQKIEDTYVDFKLVRKSLTKSIKDKIKNIKESKREFFDGKKIDINIIQKAQIEILVEVLEEKLFDLEKRRKENSQKTLDNHLTKESKLIIKKLNKNIKEIEDLKEKIQKVKDLNIIFIWDINFIEVMLEGGFDIVIANPPYVSKNDIINPKLDPEEIESFDSEKISNLRKSYKDDLNNFILTDFNYSISKSCDLYVYFFFKGMELLNEFGTMVYISSNSWLNVGFGGDLQQGILKYGNLKFIIENLIQRTFLEAEINTIITILGKNKKTNYLIGFSKFIALNKKFEDIKHSEFDEIINKDNKDRIFSFLDEEISIFNDNEYKKIRIQNNLLGKFGGKIHQSKSLESKNVFLLEDYNFAKWSIFLLADDLFFKIINQSEKICQLKDYCDVYLGMTSGFNDFFYLNKEDYKIHNIEKTFIKFLIKSPRELKSPIIKVEDLNKIAFFVEKDKAELKGTNALKYIESGENQPKPIYRRPFFTKKYQDRSKQEWYKLNPKIGRILLPNLIDKTHKVSINKNNYLVDKKLICCDPQNKNYEKAIFLTLYSTFMVYLKEIIGSTSLGGGALDVSTTDYKNLYFIDLNNIDDSIIKELSGLFEEFQDYIFSTTLDELGTEEPDNFNMDEVLEQRRKVDEIILEKIFGLNNKEQIRFYQNVINLINNRIKRSKSV